MSKFSFLLPLALCVPLAAQSAVVSVPNSDATSGICNTIPFGTTAGSSTNNVRFQTMILATDLATVPAFPQVCGLRFAACTTAEYSYDRITVRMAHTSSTTLSTSFDVNIPPGTGTTVLDATNYVWPVVADTWSDIGLQTSFAYNGVDNIVVEITTSNGLRSGPPSGFRRETRQRVYRTGYDGTQTTGTSSSSAVKLQVHFGEPSTRAFGRGCVGSNGTPEIGFNGTPSLGQNVDIELHSGPVNSGAALFIGFWNGSPYPVDLSVIGMTNCTLYLDVAIAINGATDAAGFGSSTLTALGVPCGYPIYMQWACIDPGANGLGVTLSNYGRMLLGF